MPASLLDELADILGPVGLLRDPEQLESYATDWSGWGRALPLAVARPALTAEVSEVLKLCHAHGQAVVPQGGLSGLAGGAIPVGGALALSLQRMAGVEEIDEMAATLSVRAGTTLQAAQEAALAAGFLLAMDLGGRGSAQVGGNVSTNAGGNRVIRYGMTREQVLGLEAVLADGTIIDARSKLLKNNTGIDLKHLFIGTEGTLGVVTRIVFRLHPMPRSQTVALVAMPRLDDIHALLRRAGSAFGGRLTAFEVMWADYLHLAYEAAPDLPNPFGTIAPHHVLIEIRGENEALDRADLEDFLGAELESETASDAVVSQSGRQAVDFWRIRDASGEITTHMQKYAGFDVSIPAREMAGFVAESRQALAAGWPNERAAFFGHLGDSNLHVIFGGPSLSPEAKKAVEAMIYAQVAAVRGSVSAEHGIGRMKKPYLGHSRSPEEIALMRTLKAALDPKGILNPGAVLA